MIKSAGFAFAVVVTLRVAGQSARAPVPGYRSTETHGANERGERPDVIPLARAEA